MRFALALALVFPVFGCARYQGATALTPAADGSTWVYVATNRDRRTGVYHCTPPGPDGRPVCKRVDLQ